MFLSSSKNECAHARRGAIRSGGAYSSRRDTRSIASGEDRAGNTFSSDQRLLLRRRFCDLSGQLLGVSLRRDAGSLPLIDGAAISFSSTGPSVTFCIGVRVLLCLGNPSSAASAQLQREWVRNVSYPDPSALVLRRPKEVLPNRCSTLMQAR